MALQVDSVGGTRWDAALDLLETGTAAIGFGRLVLASDPATERVGRRLHVEFACRYDPIAHGRPASDQLADIAANELAGARRTLEDACEADSRFANLVENSDVIYEYVYDYGMGTLLVATARPTGPITWKRN